ncbi:MAG: ABC transporter ATP-binding protein [Planctomycetota bacterium]
MKKDKEAPLRGVHLIRPFGRGLAVVVGLLCLLAVTDMAVPWFLKLLVDDVFVPVDGGAGNWNLVWLILPGIGLIYVSRNTLFFLSRMRSLRISEDLCFELRQRIFEHLQQLSMRFYRSHQPGRLSARLMDDTFRIQSFIQDKLPLLIRYLLEFQILLVIVYLVNWRLALASTLVLPLHLWVYRRYRRPIRTSHSEAQQHLEVAHGNAVEQFLGMEVVKGFSAEERESRSFKEALDASRRSKIRSQRFHFTQKVAADLVVGVGTVLLLGYGAWEVARGRMTGGSFLMFFWYVKMLYPAVLEVISGTGHLSRASASADRIFEMLDEPTAEPAVAEREESDPEVVAGAVAFEGVSFAYEPGAPPALTGIDLDIKAGEHVAITGPSGSGKSTLLSLLPRFNEANVGRVLIDGRPVDEMHVRSLRRLFGIVFQDLFLFDASIYENLRYARPEATPDEIIEACRATGAHEFIDRLPFGYDTRIGASGVELSRGEKQRITIARALVRNPRILILDEATASLDAVGGREIMRTILERAKGRTVVLVTHDNELLDLVDRVVSLEEGRIMFDGTPADMDHPLVSYSPGSPPSLHLRRAAHEMRDVISGDDDAGVSHHDVPAETDGPKRAGRIGPRTGGTASLLLGALLVTGSCRTEHSTRTLGMDEPRVGPGTLIIEEEEPVRLHEMAAALDAIALDPRGRRGAHERPGARRCAGAADAAASQRHRAARARLRAEAPARRRARVHRRDRPARRLHARAAARHARRRRRRPDARRPDGRDPLRLPRVRVAAAAPVVRGNDPRTRRDHHRQPRPRAHRARGGGAARIARGDAREPDARRTRGEDDPARLRRRDPRRLRAEEPRHQRVRRGRLGAGVGGVREAAVRDQDARPRVQRDRARRRQPDARGRSDRPLARAERRGPDRRPQPHVAHDPAPRDVPPGASRAVQPRG